MQRDYCERKSRYFTEIREEYRNFSRPRCNGWSCARFASQRPTATPSNTKWHSTNTLTHARNSIAERETKLKGGGTDGATPRPIGLHRAHTRHPGTATAHTMRHITHMTHFLLSPSVRTSPSPTATLASRTCCSLYIHVSLSSTDRVGDIDISHGLGRNSYAPTVHHLHI